MNYKILTSNHKEEWDNYLQALPENVQDIYYTPEYYSLYEEYGDGKAFCFVFQSGGDTALYPFLLNSINSLGYDLDQQYFDIQGAYGYNGIISSSNDPQFRNAFYQTFNHYCAEQNIVAEFTRFHPLLSNHHFSENNLHIVFDRKTVYVSLENRTHDEIFKDFQTTTKEQIKKAMNRYNIEVKVFNGNFEDGTLIYDIYTETMNLVQSDPYLFFNKQYFRTLLKQVNHFLFVCYFNGEPIAMSVVLAGKKYLHGHLVGVRNEFRKLSVYSLIYSENIRYGIESEYNYFHFGGGSTSNPDDTLLKFKKNFSKSTSDFFIGKKIHNVPIYEAIIQQWNEKFPEYNQKHSNKLLRYRDS
jgi:hypothetical protein